jgi:hypothetical protein
MTPGNLHPAPASSSNCEMMLLVCGGDTMEPGSSLSAWWEGQHHDEGAVFGSGRDTSGTEEVSRAQVMTVYAVGRLPNREPDSGKNHLFLLSLSLTFSLSLCLLFAVCPQLTQQLFRA